MKWFSTRLLALHRSETAATTVEYLTLLVLVALGTIATIAFLGDELRTLFAGVHDEMSSGEIRGGLSAEQPTSDNER